MTGSRSGQAVRTLRVATYNIHKGFSHFNRRMMVHELRDRIRGIGADLIFLQEVLGEHSRHAARYPDWPAHAQHEFLADSVWTDFAYGRNAVYNEGHHGNAVLSRFPIQSWENQDVSAHRLESRGLLHCVVAVPGWAEPLHCVCVHLGLTGRWRRRQLQALATRIHQLVPDGCPLVIAGDFNDWRHQAGEILGGELQLTEAFEFVNGRPARSFPAALPVFRLDRIYVRGFHIESARVLHGWPWSRLSDHAALMATLVRA